jgi:hypothetical protein
VKFEGGCFDVYIYVTYFIVGKWFFGLCIGSQWNICPEFGIVGSVCVYFV